MVVTLRPVFAAGKRFVAVATFTTQEATTTDGTGMTDSFAEYVTVRGPALRRFAYVLCGDRHLAEDLVQEVLARMHRSWSRVEATELPDAYVRKAIVHEHLSWRRRLMNREHPEPDLPERVGAGDDADTLAGRDEMWRLLATLPRMQRVVLVLRFYEDLTFDEIATLLGTAPSTVRVHATRGLARLRIDTGADSAVASEPTSAQGGIA
jgi:RNA polymerase sigma-70 factor (sigma-E family)